MEGSLYERDMTRDFNTVLSGEEESEFGRLPIAGSVICTTTISVVRGRPCGPVP